MDKHAKQTPKKYIFNKKIYAINEWKNGKVPFIPKFAPLTRPYGSGVSIP